MDTFIIIALISFALMVISLLWPKTKKSQKIEEPISVTHSKPKIDMKEKDVGHIMTLDDARELFPRLRDRR